METNINFCSFASTQGLSRRAFLKYCTTLVTLLGLPTSAATQLAAGLGGARKKPVMWLSFQECTGCTESFTRAFSPTFESLIFDFFSLDYHHTLQAAAGEAAEAAKTEAIEAGGYLLVVEGAVPLAEDGACSTIAGHSNLDTLRRSASKAEAIIAVGSCATFSGLPGAAPNPTDAVGIEQLMGLGLLEHRPLINLPGCPPLPEAISATLAHLIVYGQEPQLDALHRPRAIYGNTVHDRCPRLQFYYQGKFATTFDDEGARQGWCLYELGCKGPTTHNACPTQKWNQGTSTPIDSGHPCIGCSEPGFWDTSGLYVSLKPSAQTPLPGESDQVDKGRKLFDDNCVYCHEPNGQDLSTPLDEVPSAYRERGGRAHRMQVEDEQWRALVEYLESQR